MQVITKEAHSPINAAVALLIFNRPDKIKKILDVLRQVKPEKLLVIADGPRNHNLNDAKKCAETRALIEKIDWDCHILKNYSESNMGCARRVLTGLDWVFEQVEEAIILEDDCIPELSFFRFCNELLERYKDDERIMSISGQNVQFGRNRTQWDYYFSRYNHCWGWATWKRAWQHFDYGMTLWPRVRDSGVLEDILQDPHYAKSWAHTFQLVYENRLDSWAFRWTFACWMQSGLSILPNVNLVSNIGFGDDATHTAEKSIFLGQSTEILRFPLSHPPILVRNSKADDFTQKTLFNYHPRLTKRVIKKLQKILGVSTNYSLKS
jgi:hypothetical protein